MSNTEAEVDTSCCASCGIAGVDDIKLKECDRCDLVKYCSDECQKEHTSQHEEACKKRAAELRDELLFKQPESSHFGDCPICMIPLPLDRQKSAMCTCCSKVICNGCTLANHRREFEAKMKSKCPFCREATPTTDKGMYEQLMRRMKVNDPEALNHQGMIQFYKGDFSGAFENWAKAAQLGDVDAHYKLSNMYSDGLGVEKDRGKEMYHVEEAAIGGHPYARYNLGCEEMRNGNIERGVKHWIIAARQGQDGATKPLMKLFKRGFVSKEDLAAALRAHQAAVDATRCPQREAAEEFVRENNIRQAQIKRARG